MVILRLTKSLALKSRLPLNTDPAPSTTKLGDWTCDDFRLGSKHFILCVSEVSKLPVVIEGAPYANFPDRLKTNLRTILLRIGIGDQTIENEINAMDGILFSKANSRSVLGTQVEYIKHLDFQWNSGRYPSLDPVFSSLHLAEIPMSNLKYFNSIEETLNVFGKPTQPTLKLVR